MDAPMEQTIEGTVTMLQPKEWLWKVDQSGLLCILLIPHFLRPPITMLVIKQFLCLIYEEILWVSKPSVSHLKSFIEFCTFHGMGEILEKLLTKVIISEW